MVKVREGKFPIKTELIINNKRIKTSQRNIVIRKYQPHSKTVITEPHSDIVLKTNEELPVKLKIPDNTEYEIYCLLTKNNKVLAKFKMEGSFKTYSTKIYYNKELKGGELKFASVSKNKVKKIYSTMKIEVTSRFPQQLWVTGNYLKAKARRFFSTQSEYDMFLIENSFVEPTAYFKPWYQIKLSEDTVRYVNESSLKPSSILKTINEVKSIIAFEKDNGIYLYLRGMRNTNFKIEKMDNSQTLNIRFFNTVADGKLEMNIDHKLNIVGQLSKLKDSLQLNLNFPFQVKWGYSVKFDNNYAIIRINKNIKNKKQVAICLDPGHGGDENGAVGPSGLFEKYANLILAKAVRNKLIEMNYKVILTRDEDRKVPLYERPLIAIKNKADIFVSLHYNSCPPSVNPLNKRGLESYYYFDSGKYLAKSIQSSILDNFKNIKDNGVKYASLAVCRNYEIPSCLIETDYIVVPKVCAVITNEDYTNKISGAIAKGIDNYIRSIDN
jgi:N-acetylmuramoyl-L-alanine amidase